MVTKQAMMGCKHNDKNIALAVETDLNKTKRFFLVSKISFNLP